MKTTHEYRGFVFTVTYEAAEPAFSVDFPDVSEIITSGRSLPEAFANACEALDSHLESLQKLGRRLPRRKCQLVVQEIV